MEITELSQIIIRTGRWSIIMSASTLLLVLISIFFKYDEQKKYEALQYQLEIGNAEIEVMKLSLENIKDEVRKNKTDADNAGKKIQLEFKRICNTIVREQKITDERRKKYDEQMNAWMKRNNIK